MDINNSNVPPATNIYPKPPAPSEAVVETAYVEETKGSLVPYLAKLTAFTVVFLSVLYSLSTLIAHLVEKLMVKPEANSYDYSYFSGIDSFLVVSSIATLMIALPASALLLFFTRRSENSEGWRLSQKWRRIIYTVSLVILVLSIISTLVGTVYTVFSHSLNLDVGSSYSGYGSDSGDKPDKQAGAKIAAAVISGLVAVVIFILGGITLASEYGSKWRQFAWAILVLFSLTAAIVGTVSIVKVQEQIKEQTKKQQEYSKQNYENDAYSSSSSYGNSSADYSTAKSDLQAVKSDLTYYAGKNGGKYPSKTQWDNGSLKPTYLLSSDETLKKITYAPTCTKSEPPVCNGYTLSMKDENGETVSLSNDSNATY